MTKQCENRRRGRRNGRVHTIIYECCVVGSIDPVHLPANDVKIVTIYNSYCNSPQSQNVPGQARILGVVRLTVLPLPRQELIVWKYLGSRQTQHKRCQYEHLHDIHQTTVETTKVYFNLGAGDDSLRLVVDYVKRAKRYLTQALVDQADNRNSKPKYEDLTVCLNSRSAPQYLDPFPLKQIGRH